MKTYEATEIAYKNGYEKGYADWKELLNAAIAGQETLQKYISQRWIPVTERLPESGKEAVMIALRWGEVDIGWCEDEKWGSEFVNEYEDGEVTHWMPLPPAPKGE